MSLHHFILLNFCVKGCHNYCMNYWVMAQKMFCEVIVTFNLWRPKSKSVHPLVQVHICRKFEENSFWHSWDIMFPRMGWINHLKHNASSHCCDWEGGQLWVLSKLLPLIHASTPVQVFSLLLLKTTNLQQINCSKNKIPLKYQNLSFQ